MKRGGLSFREMLRDDPPDIWDIGGWIMGGAVVVLLVVLPLFVLVTSLIEMV